MKKFLINILLIFLLTMFLGEFFSRVFSLKSKIIDYTNYQSEPGYSYYSNYKKGVNVFFKVPALKKNQFSTNDIGFNTTLDFKDFNAQKINVAFLGDSFVEGFHVDVENNFSSLLMKKSKNIQSYDFGISGFNGINFYEIYRNFDMERFDYVFVVLEEGDLKSTEPFRSNKKKKGLILSIYSNSYFINYLNKVNGIFKLFSLLFKFKVDKKETDVIPIKIDERVRELLNKKNLYIVPRNKNTHLLLEEMNYSNVIKILHEKTPIDFGTSDTHFNKNGRQNVINSVYPYITELN